MRLLVRAFPAFLLLALPVASLAAGGFTLTSPDIKDGGSISMAQVFNGFGCKGGDFPRPCIGRALPPAPRVLP